MFNKRTKIKTLLASDAANLPTGQAGYPATVMGWVRTFRNNQFIALNDGSTNNNLQVLAELGKFDETILKRITTGACIKATGEIIPSLGKGQKVELKASSIEILGDSDAEKFPLQPKKHSLEFLREIAHLRFRTNTFGSVFRVRHTLAFAVHKFFNEKGFVYMHTPVITASDAEGAGEMFRVTTLPIDGTAPKNEDGSINFKEDFFGRSTNLTVSGQLEGELAAMAFSDIYTFGPTFRAENSNTTRHLAEFWMIEPEMAFYDLEAAKANNIKVVRVPVYSPHAVAEHAVALILTLNRKTHKAYNRVREANFSLERLTGFDLYEKTIGVIGTGKIGEAFCNIMLGFGCKVLAFDLMENKQLTAKGVEYLPLIDVLHQSDIISLHCPLNEQTKHLIGKQTIAMMKDEVMLINTSRGALIDTPAAIEALKTGKIGYLGLDVYEQEEKLFFNDLSENVIQDDIIMRLLSFSNVLITAHQGFFTEEALTQIAQTTLSNIDAFEAGKPLKNAVV